MPYPGWEFTGDGGLGAMAGHWRCRLRCGEGGVSGQYSLVQFSQFAAWLSAEFVQGTHAP
jgi:hypothetical protein